MPFDIDFRDTPTWRKATQEAKLENTFEIAKTMLIKGFNIIQVQDVTGLTLEQIQALEKEINP